MHPTLQVQMVLDTPEERAALQKALKEFHGCVVCFRSNYSQVFKGCHCQYNIQCKQLWEHVNSAV